ncbi:MAG: PadR family transcriptional regulator [Brevinematales bacterium]|nr:PadR family transcriptional regulator [Brevinematales bacterium]
MKYINDPVSNVEFMLMEIIAECREISGYEINTFVEGRGYREWADIGTTSIYVGLEKLNKKGLASSRVDLEKTGKGPLPKLYSLTGEGFALLKHSVLDALSSGGSRGGRFDLGLSGMPLLSTAETLSSLEKRREKISRSLAGVRETYLSQGGDNLPLSVRALFDHSFAAMRNEIDFASRLIEQINSGNKGEI